MAETFNQPEPDRIVAGGENDRDRRSCRLRRQPGRSVGGDQNRHLSAHQIGGQNLQFIVVPVRKTVLDQDILPDYEASIR